MADEYTEALDDGPGANEDRIWRCLSETHEVYVEAKTAEEALRLANTDQREGRER